MKKHVYSMSCYWYLRNVLVSEAIYWNAVRDVCEKRFLVMTNT